MVLARRVRRPRLQCACGPHGAGRREREVWLFADLPGREHRGGAQDRRGGPVLHRGRGKSVLPRVSERGLLMPLCARAGLVGQREAGVAPVQGCRVDLIVTLQGLRPGAATLGLVG